MSCCSRAKPSTDSLACPLCDSACKSVSLTTVLHHLKEPWKWPLAEQNYYFCETAHCDGVYIAQDRSVIRKAQIRTSIGCKDSSGKGTLCYCFGVSYTQAEDNPEIQAYVLQQTKEKVCACDVRNPSGRCCLKSFP